METPTHFTVEIKTKGPYGTIVYREGVCEVEFGWEFCSGDTVAEIWLSGEPVGPPCGCDRPTLLKRVAGEVLRQRASQCWAQIDEQAGKIYIRTSHSETSSRRPG